MYCQLCTRMSFGLKYLPHARMSKPKIPVELHHQEVQQTAMETELLLRQENVN